MQGVIWESSEYTASYQDQDNPAQLLPKSRPVIVCGKYITRIKLNRLLIGWFLFLMECITGLGKISSLPTASGDARVKLNWHNIDLLIRSESDPKRWLTG